MEIILLWFQCKNPNCNYISPDNNKRRKKYGLSKQQTQRPRLFMKYSEGVKMYSRSDLIMFNSVLYGDICLFNYDNPDYTNSHMKPIKDKELCKQCIKQLQNESLLYPNKE